MGLTSETLLGSGIVTPTGYTHAAAAITLASPLSESIVLTIAASGVINVDPVVGFTALDTAVKAAIDATNLLAMGIEFTSNDIDATYTITKITRDFGASQYSTTDNFLVNVKIDWEKV